MMTTTSPLHQDVLERIRAEYLEMPGMRLRPEQVQRLCGVDGSLCRQVLDSLVHTKFLCVKPDGSYARLTDGAPSRLRTAKAELNTSALVAISRRAS